MPRPFTFNLERLTAMSHDKALSYVNHVLFESVVHHYPFMVVTTQHKALPCSGRNEADVRAWVSHKWPDAEIISVDPM
jgi:hypothetical protein